MPVKSPPRERPLLEMLLSECENGTWQAAARDWVEERVDGAVEVVATRADGQKLAVEHTIVQPFVDEKKDSNIFLRAFGRIEKNPALTLPDRDLTVVIPVAAIPVGYNWDDVGADLLAWLMANHQYAPKEGESRHSVSVGASSKLGALELDILLQTTHLPAHPGMTLISRGPMPKNLAQIVDKALRDKLPKLVNTAANKRLLLVERQHVSLGDTQILQEIGSLAPAFPLLDKVDEIWIVDTSMWSSDDYVSFKRFAGTTLVEIIVFQAGVVKMRRKS